MEIQINIYLLSTKVSKSAVVQKSLTVMQTQNTNNMNWTPIIDHTLQCCKWKYQQHIADICCFFIITPWTEIWYNNLHHTSFNCFLNYWHWWHNIWTSRIDFLSSVNFFVWWSLKDCNNSISHWQLIFFNVLKDSSVLLLKYCKPLWIKHTVEARYVSFYCKITPVNGKDADNVHVHRYYCIVLIQSYCKQI